MRSWAIVVVVVAILLKAQVCCSSRRAHPRRCLARGACCRLPARRAPRDGRTPPQYSADPHAAIAVPVLDAWPPEERLGAGNGWSLSYLL